MVEIGIDIGGTFVDVVCVRGEGEMKHVKVPTRPRDLVGSVREGIEQLLHVTGIAPDQVTRVVHGSTVATNAIIERRSKPIGLLMTDGFEDTLEIGRQKRFDMYNLFIDSQTPVFLAPRRLRYGIRERIDWQGHIVSSLVEDDVVRAANEAIARYEVQAFAVCYLFSFRNPKHELKTRELLKKISPQVRVSLSCEVDPTFREYERVCLTAFDAYLKPIVGSYIVELEGALGELGIRFPLQVMQSRGAIITARNAIERPIAMFLSGPAGGVVGGTVCAQASGLGDVITMDMGGTSNDVAIVKDGKPLSSSEQSIREYPVRIPMVDISTVGAGGGSIAWLDSGGNLKVGPQSAGADPGPACYGRGGTSPTVTDAMLLLGYLPEMLAGGSMRLQRSLAEKAISTIARKLEIDPIPTAVGVMRIVNANMAEQVRLMSVKRGHDARKFGLVVLGGGGPLHGCEIAKTEIGTVLVPQAPGVLSAFGMLVADLEHHHARSISMKVGEADFDVIKTTLSELRQINIQLMEKERVDLKTVRVATIFDMRYVGQSYEVPVSFDQDITPETLKRLVDKFHALHHEIYGYDNQGHPVEILTAHIVHVSPTAKPSVRPGRADRSLMSAQRATRSVWWPGHQWVDTPVYERKLLPIGLSNLGPAIVEQLDTTTAVPPKASYSIDVCGNLLINLEEMAA